VQALAMATDYFKEWYPSAAKFKKASGFLITECRYREAAFNLHQATERLYHCVLLVCTFYTPHVHKLGFLRTQAGRLDMRLVDVWPRESRADRARFEKLKEAYVKARYSKYYRVSEGEFAWLGNFTDELGRIVYAICSERLAELGLQSE
jgi:uncharacterized protein